MVIGKTKNVTYRLKGKLFCFILFFNRTILSIVIFILLLLSDQIQQALSLTLYYYNIIASTQNENNTYRRKIIRGSYRETAYDEFSPLLFRIV